MDAGAAALASVIGARVRQERQSRRWTLDQLAAAAGVSRRMLINVEQGAANPSVGTLLRLSDALGVGLPALVEPPAPTPVRVVRAGKGAALWASETGGRGVLVAGTEPPDVVELWDWTLPVGDRYVSEPHASGTRELAQVLEGTVQITVAGQPVTLEVGDAVTFFGDVPHAYANVGSTRARFTLAVFERGGVEREVVARVAASCDAQIMERIAPVFAVHNLAAAMDFYQRLGFVVRAYAGGGYGFATRHGLEVHLGVVSEDDRRPSAAYLFVDDADQLAAEWRSAGVEVHPPQDTEWGQHEGALVDPDGNVIRFGSPIARAD